MNALIAITGTPATGKSRLARAVMRKCRNSAVIEINDVVKSKHLFSGLDIYGSMVVDRKRLSEEIRGIAKGKARSGKTVIVVGHLAPELSLRYGIAIVTRAKLKTLVARMRRRGYPQGKIRENIEAEALDYCGKAMKGKCKELYEVESGDEISRVIGYIEKVCAGVKAPKPKSRMRGDKLYEFYDLVRKRVLDG